MINENTDALAEAYTAIDNIATKLFHNTNPEVDEDTYRFLKSMATQINVYRVALIKSGRTH